MPNRKEILGIFHKSLSFLPSAAAARALAACNSSPGQVNMPHILSDLSLQQIIPPFLPDLARIEAAVANTGSAAAVGQSGISGLQVNATLQVLELSWKGLSAYFVKESSETPEPQNCKEYILVYRHWVNSEIVVRSALSEDLLLLKMVAEDKTPEHIAALGNMPVDAVYAALDRAVEAGYLRTESSHIRRAPFSAERQDGLFGRFLQSSFMTLQWHVTQTCDLHCRHCYDRSDRSSMQREDGIRILDDFSSFCRERRVRGQISFSGGNPLLYPHFVELYRAAADRGFVTAILGNPSPRGRIEELIAIQAPSFFQVSLEGLQEHNDLIRGEGHFMRVMAFLSILREFGVYSMVMLTLTEDNVDQVIPLAEILREKTDTFNFNRLSMVGEGSTLRLPSKERYRAFLNDYLKAAEANPVMGIKDNLFNILFQQQGGGFFGGCTGFGCGAAFNFFSVLPDGEAHACRKFPSPIGNILKQGFAGVYNSDAASRYRQGCSVCSACSIRPVCGGCLAVSYGHGLDLFSEKDPYCFLD
ncbi:MAG: selenobiotic family peptide radical SAM maturase [Nitrospirae bacterium]|nr:selenobiotic family peptide radical SAM maturase [Nitrospirota bacterium]